MCCWMVSYFHDWIDYIGVAHFRIFGGENTSSYLKNGSVHFRMTYLRIYNKGRYINRK